jgi:uncharacterized membrane protein
VAEDDISVPTSHTSKRLLAGQESRGEDMGRILALTDGVFAFALTLLVLTLTVPSVPLKVAGVSLPPAVVSGNLGHALWMDYGAFAGYVFVFVMIAYWWLAHHRLFRYIVRYDDVLVSLNLLLLLEVAVMPFVLKVFVSYDETQVAVILFSLIQISAALTIGAIWRYASRNHRLIPSEVPDWILRYFGARTLITPAVFAVSIAVSFVNVTAAEFLWVSVFAARWLAGYSATHPGQSAASP